MRSVRSEWFLLITLFCLGAILSCSQKTDPNKPEGQALVPPTASAEKTAVKIGVVAPYDGPNAHIGEMIKNSVKLYFDENPVAGVEVELLAVDTRSSTSDAVAAMQTTVADSSVVALIGFYHSSTALSCKPIIQETGLPTLIYSASNPTVTDDAPSYFRLVPTDDNQAIVLADYAQQLGANKLGILYYADEYGKGLADGISARARSVGIEVVGFQSYDDSTTDFRPMLTVLKGKSPDVVAICGFVELSIAILNQAAEKGLSATFIAGDGTFNEEQLIAGAGRNAEGVYVAAPYVFDEENPRNAAFLEGYWNAYNSGSKRRKPVSWSAFAYDAAGILAQALSEGHMSRGAIQSYLGTINDIDSAYKGITGAIYFNAKGDAVNREFRMAVVRDQQFVSAR